MGEGSCNLQTSSNSRRVVVGTGQTTRSIVMSADNHDPGAGFSCELGLNVGNLRARDRVALIRRREADGA